MQEYETRVGDLIDVLEPLEGFAKTGLGERIALSHSLSETPTDFRLKGTPKKEFSWGCWGTVCLASVLYSKGVKRLKIPKWRHSDAAPATQQLQCDLKAKASSG